MALRQTWHFYGSVAIMCYAATHTRVDRLMQIIILLIYKLYQTLCLGDMSDSTTS